VAVISAAVWAPFVVTSDISFFSCGVFAPLFMEFCYCETVISAVQPAHFAGWDRSAGSAAPPKSRNLTPW
jgi:hypothetical protein